MTRIEKTQINTSAFMVLSSTLKKVQSDNIIEILEGGTKIIIRPKTESEKHDFTIDLSFLDIICSKKINAFIGENSVGKSNIFDAIN